MQDEQPSRLTVAGNVDDGLWCHDLPRRNAIANDDCLGRLRSRIEEPEVAGKDGRGGEQQREREPFHLTTIVAVVWLEFSFSHRGTPYESIVSVPVTVGVQVNVHLLLPLWHQPTIWKIGS